MMRYSADILKKKSFFNFPYGFLNLNYCKVASSELSRLVAHLRIFRLFIKGWFDAYVLWPFVKKVQKWIVDRSTARHFMVFFFYCEF